MQIVAFVAISLCVLQFPLREGWAGEPIFPTPNRPVAQIISAEYSDEKTRDLHQEAERVMDLLGIKPGVRVADLLGHDEPALSFQEGLPIRWT